MKLIIDIDEDYVKLINKNGASNYTEEVIANGTPLNDLRAKIEQLPITDTAIRLVTEILDKYRAESEE